MALAVVVAKCRRAVRHGDWVRLWRGFFEAAFRRRLFPSFLGVLEDAEGHRLAAVSLLERAVRPGTTGHTVALGPLAGPLQVLPSTPG